MTNKTKTNWRKVKLGEVGKIVTGKTPSTKEPKNFGGPFPFITIPDLKDQRYVVKTERTVSETGAQKMKTLKLPLHSVVMSCLATVGETGITTKDSFTNQQINSVICDPEVIDYRFLYYAFRRLKRRLLKYDGSVYINISKSKFSELEIELPQITDQKRIAGILSAFDDNIELNNKISRTLEQMTQAIFKEWFVNFRFPGHEKVKIVDSELGKIPEGWEVKSLDEIANFLNGLALQKYRPSNDRDVLPVIKIREMNNGVDKNTELASSSIDEKYKVKSGDILFSWSGSLELMRWTERVGALNQHLFKVTSENYPNWFIFYWTQKHLPFFRVIASGKATSMGHIQRYHLSEAQVIVPPSVILTKADEIISPMFKNILELRLENQKLAALRDLLLPKLMSGEIKV